MEYFQSAVAPDAVLNWGLLEIEYDKETIEKLEDFSE